MNIEEIEGLTIRTYSVLKRNNINTVEEVKAMSYRQITSLKNIHRKSVEELEEKLGIEFVSTMKIQKVCTQEIIECESTEEPDVYIKRQFTLDGNLKKEKKIDVNMNRICGKFQASAKHALESLVLREGYKQVD